MFFFSRKPTIHLGYSAWFLNTLLLCSHQMLHKLSKRARLHITEHIVETLDNFQAKESWATEEGVDHWILKDFEFLNIASNTSYVNGLFLFFCTCLNHLNNIHLFFPLLLEPPRNHFLFLAHLFLFFFCPPI